MTAEAKDVSRPLDLGFQLDFIAGAAVLTDEDLTFLIVEVRKPPIRGQRQSATTAVCTFDGCLAIRHGYPNDEPRPSIERFKYLPSDMVEISNSTWADEVEGQNRLAYPDRTHRAQRHLMFLFKDSTFECLCNGVEVAFYDEERPTVIGQIARRLR